MGYVLAIALSLVVSTEEGFSLGIPFMAATVHNHLLIDGTHHTHTNSSKKHSSGNQNRAFFILGLGRDLIFNCGFNNLQSKQPQQARRRATRPVRVTSEKVEGFYMGTTNLAMAAMEGGKPVIFTNAEGQQTTPSVVSYSKNDDRLVGQIAKGQAMVNPKINFFSMKRFIGRKMSEVLEESKKVSFCAVSDDNSNVKLD